MALRGRLQDRARVFARVLLKGLKRAAIATLAGSGRGLAMLWRLVAYAWRLAWVHAPTTGAVLTALLALSINAFDSFKINDRSDAVSEQAAGIITGPFYGGLRRTGQDQITVVLINAETMRLLESPHWPPPYSDTADLLQEIATAKPKAIFLDYHFDQPQLASFCTDIEDCKAARKREIKDFARRLKRIPDDGVPLFIGAVGPDPGLAPLRDLPQLPVAFEEERIFGYPLSAPLVEGGPSRPAVAPTLYAVLKGQTPPTRPDDRVMAIDWGFGMSEAMAPYAPNAGRGRACQGGDMAQRLVSFLEVTKRSAFAALYPDEDDPFDRRCSYADTIPAHWLINGISPQAKGFLKDRIVLVGVDLRYLADFRPTPLFGQTPGVTVHAMALDNLIQTRDEPTLYPRPLAMGLTWADVMQGVLLAFGVCLVFAWRRWRRTPPERGLRWRDRLVILAIVGLTGVAASVALNWPMFILLGAMVTGAGAMLISDQIRTFRRTRSLRRRLTARGATR